MPLLKPLVLASMEQGVESISARENAIGEGGAHFLATLERFGPLRRIDLSGNPLSGAARERLAALHGVEVELSPLVDVME